MITEARRKALEIMADGREHGGAVFGSLMGWKGRPQGIGRAATTLLQRMAKDGLVRHVWAAQPYRYMFRITEKGRKALEG